MKNIGMEVPSLSLSKPYLQNLLNEEKSTQISFGISSKGRKKLVAPRSQDLIGVSKPAIRKLARRGGVYPVKGLEYQEKINPLDEIYTIDSILDKRVIQVKEKNFQPKFIFFFSLGAIRIFNKMERIFYF